MKCGNFLLALFFFLLCYREVSADEGKRLAEQWRAAFCETSAKENQVLITWRWDIKVFVKHIIIYGIDLELLGLELELINLMGKWN